MHRNTLLHILAELEQRLALCEYEIAIGTRGSFSSMVRSKTGGKPSRPCPCGHERTRGLILSALSLPR
jgi:hypothetical protein